MEQFKEQLDNGISKCEKDIKHKIGQEWDQYEKNLEVTQHNRNRTIVEQIIKTSAEFRKDNKSYFDKLREEFDEN